MDKIREAAIRIMSLVVIMTITIPIAIVSLLRLAENVTGSIIM
jgi:hypothetical protein